jgi:cold shock CspA family protein
MQLPLQVTTRNLSLSAAAEETIRNKAEKLDLFCGSIMGCRVVVDAPHRHKNKGVLYCVRLDITVPGAELVIKREPHEDIYVSIRDTFDAARRKLQDYVRKQRGRVKQHEEAPHARISKLFANEGYGFLTTPDGREVYFHRNSLLNTPFEKLELGAEVRFVEEMGEEGPQASTVTKL